MIKKSLLAVLIFFSFQLSAEPIYRYAICTVFRDEAPFLKEWIEFNRLMGAEHFWLYNNDSVDNYREVLEPYIQEGLVELIDWPRGKIKGSFCYQIQIKAFNDCLKKSQGVAEWVGFLDVDEFLFSTQAPTVYEILENHYAEYSSVAVNWQLFGTSGIEDLDPTRLLIEQLVMKAVPDHQDNLLCKTIVRPDKVRSFRNPHWIYTDKPSEAVDALCRPHHLPRSPTVSIDLLRINHYWIRSEKYFREVKWERLKKRHWTEKRRDELLSTLNAVEDDSILIFAELLRERVFEEVPSSFFQN